MHMRNDAGDDIVRALLASTDVAAPVPGGWHATLYAGGRIDIRVRRIGEWIEIAAAGPALDEPRRTSDGWSLLRLNTRLDGAIRIGCGGDGHLLLVADLPIGDAWAGGEPIVGAPLDVAPGEGTLAARLTATVDELRLACLEIAEPRTDLASETALEASRSADSARLGRLCADAGWPFASDASGETIVWLPLGGGRVPAAVSMSRDAKLEAMVAMADSPPGSAVCRGAVAAALLRLSASSRAVKGIVIRNGDDALPAIASAWPAPVSSATALDLAMSAIAVACRQARAEVDALYDDAIARHYLSLQEPRWRLEPATPVNDLQEDTPCLRLL
jgi:hypothetical protein